MPVHLQSASVLGTKLVVLAPPAVACIHETYYIFNLHSDLPLGKTVKVTTPKTDTFLKQTSTYSCLKCTPTIHESLRSVLETSIFIEAL